MTDPTAPDPSPWNNGLLATSYVPLTDVSAPMAPQLLVALERARIAAYLAEAPDAHGALRLYVAAAERADARTIVAAVVRASGGVEPTEVGAVADPLAGMDTDAEFAALIADWHVDTHTAIRDAERELSREDEDWRQRLDQPSPQQGVEDGLTWLDDDHFVPPNPPPIPRPTAPIVLGLLLVALSIVVLAFGGELGLSFEASLFLAVCGILSATGVFVMRLRSHPDEDDDGAVL
jgi:hypothetical protein